jgi:hypothetical protein
MDLDGIDYELFILKKEKNSELIKKYQEYESDMKMIIQEYEMKIQENTYREMLLLLKLIKPSYLPCKIKLRNLPSDVIDKKTM